MDRDDDLKFHEFLLELSWHIYEMLFETNKFSVLGKVNFLLWVNVLNQTFLETSICNIGVWLFDHWSLASFPVTRTLFVSPLLEALGDWQMTIKVSSWIKGLVTHSFSFFIRTKIIDKLSSSLQCELVSHPILWVESLHDLSCHQYIIDSHS